MASPTIASRTESNLTTAGASFPISFVQTTGDFVLILASSPAAQWSMGGVEGFTQLHATVQTPALTAAYKILDGSEGGSISAASVGGNQKGAALAYNIQGFDTVQMPEVSADNNGDSVAPQPNAVTPTGGAKDYLWIACFVTEGEEADDDTWCNSGPSGFGNLIQKTSGIGGAASTNCTIAAADLASNAASMDPAQFNIDVALAWRTLTIAVHPAAPAVEKMPIPHRVTLQVVARRVAI